MDLFRPGDRNGTLAPALAGNRTLTDKTYDIIVAGGGIAGFSAALTAARRGRSTLVLTGDVLGGQLLNIERIDGYPGFPEGVPGYDLCPIAQEQATEAGAEIEMAALASLTRHDDRWTVTTDSATYDARCVIIATGTTLRDIGVPGEDSLRGKGVSQCASCDAPLLRSQDVVVVGGGDSALQEALTLAEHCASVTIVHHGDEPAAQATYRTAAATHANVSTRPNSELAAILGDGAVTGATIRDLATGATSDLRCTGVFVFVGLRPNTGFVDDPVLLDANGAMLTDAAMRTQQTGLLAAGTVRSGSVCRAAAAAGDGMTAALTADRYLADNDWLADV
jgi:thioredoxin reductase (NADPH)